MRRHRPPSEIKTCQRCGIWGPVNVNHWRGLCHDCRTVPDDTPLGDACAVCGRAMLRCRHDPTQLARARAENRDVAVRHAAYGLCSRCYKANGGRPPVPDTAGSPDRLEDGEWKPNGRGIQVWVPAS